MCLCHHETVQGEKFILEGFKHVNSYNKTKVRPHVSHYWNCNVFVVTKPGRHMCLHGIIIKQYVKKNDSKRLTIIKVFIAVSEIHCFKLTILLNRVIVRPLTCTHQYPPNNNPPHNPIYCRYIFSPPTLLSNACLPNLKDIWHSLVTYVTLIKPCCPV